MHIVDYIAKASNVGFRAIYAIPDRVGRIMKLVVMIPSRNEEGTIGNVIREIPKQIAGISEIEVIVIDGASTDRTREIALESGAAYVYEDHINRGLASAFRTGLLIAIRRGADVIVNTDADLQYDQKQISDIVAPIINREADMVMGSRFKGWIEDMPLKKKIGNRIATFATSVLAGQKLSDTQSGFRAIHRELAKFLIVEGKKTYVQETIIRAVRAGFIVKEVPIRFRKRSDESRLIASVWRYAFKVFPDLLNVYIQVAAMRFFGGLALLLLLLYSPVLAAAFLFIATGSLSFGLALLASFFSYFLPVILLFCVTGLILDQISKLREHIHAVNPLDS